MTTTTPDTLIQVWGLWRSGTNYVEYLIRNNIKNNNYQRREAYNEFSDKLDSLKHCVMDASTAKYHICIYKPERQWLESHKRYTQKKVLDPVKTYREWRAQAAMFEMTHGNVLLINYNDFIGKELYWLRYTGWDLEFEDIFKIPIRRMGKESGTDFEQ